MLVCRRGGQLALVTHPDHGRLAGALCEHWGSERFPAPAACEALVYAATHHDDGWAELDWRPAFNEEAARPAHFLELPLHETVEPYGRGVDAVYAHDLQAGALVSMHWAGLYSTRWGIQGGEQVGHPAAAAVVAEQERRWVGALREAWGGRGVRSDFEADVWHAYEVLQSLDFISLALCLVDLERPSAAGDPVPLPATLRSVDQLPEARVIPAVRAAGGERLDLTLRLTAPGVVQIDPYPFVRETFEVDVPLRALEDRDYASAAEAAEAFHAAPLVPRTCTISGP